MDWLLQAVHAAVLPGKVPLPSEEKEFAGHDTGCAVPPRQYLPSGHQS